MKAILILPILFIFTSCGDLLRNDVREGARRKYNTSNPEFNSYKSDFERVYTQETGRTINISSLPVNFEALEGSTVGVCWYIPSGNEVFIDPDYWATASETKRRILIFHELGHCVLGRGHKNTTHNGINLSVMNSSVISSSLYNSYDDFYDEELITKRDTDFINYLNSL